MACQQLISHVTASARYLATLSAEHQATALNGQIAAVKTYIAKIAGPCEAMQASDVIREHYGPHLSAEQLRDLVCLLNDVACKLPLEVAGKAAAAGGPGQQYWHDQFWRDVPKEVFDCMADKAVQATSRMQTLFRYLAERGLRFPSEKTFSAMLALFFYADGCPAGVNSATLLAAVQQLKDAWKAYIKEYKRCNPDADNASWNWPGPPGVMCVRVDFVRFMNIFIQIPVRQSHGSVQQQGRARGQPLTVFESPPTSSGICRALTFDTAGAGAGAPLAIDFPGHRGIAAGALVGGVHEEVVARPNGGEGMLALPAPAAKLALPAPAADAIQARATAVGGEATPVPAARARMPLAAVTAQLQVDSARRDAEKKEKAKEKRKTLAAKKAKKQKQKMKAADKEDAAEKKTAGKKKKKTAGKKLKKLSKKRLTLKKKSLAKDSKTPLAHASDLPCCKECGSPDYLELADGNLAELCSWCAEAQADAQPVICKKPAACLKKPAAAKAAAAKPSGPVPPEADRKANRSADPTAKKIFFMKWGCSKCRWQAGCTKSCWSARNMEMPEDVS